MRQTLDANYHILRLNKGIWAQKPFDANAIAEEDPARMGR